MSPEEMGNRLLYRDGLMLIIDKPAGLAVHKGPKDHKGGASIEDYFDALRFGLPRMPALASMGRPLGIGALLELIRQEAPGIEIGNFTRPVKRMHHLTIM